jgi:uncharacterized repeat protein (TIGR01451 family)
MRRITRIAPAVFSLVAATSALAAPNVQITKSCPGLRYLGRVATFEITVSNSGDTAADNVVVTDMVPQGISFLKASDGGMRQGGNVVWQLGKLGAGESKTLKTSFQCDRIGKFNNVAKVTYCVEATATCEMEVRGIPAILLECVDDPDPIEVGGSVTYTIVVTNQGSAVGTNIAITCTLPGEEEYVSSSGPTNATVNGQQISFQPLPSLAPKARATYRVNIKGVGEGDVRFKVEMISDQIKTPVMETESTNIYR